MAISKAFRYDFTSIDAAAAFYKRVKKMPDIQTVQHPQQNMVYDYKTVLVTPHPSCLFSIHQKLELDKLYEQFQQAEKERQELFEKSRHHREAKKFKEAMKCLNDASHVFENI